MINDIIAIAKRDNNKKRKFLLVNKIQGKHVPVSPKKALELFDMLYENVKHKFEKENILVIGFSETATAIGSRLAINLGCNYIQTTREYKEGIKYIFFSEEHSHAEEQKLAFSDIDNISKNIDRIVFAEDEITTGKTIFNIVNIIKNSFSDNNNKIKFTAVSILNGMSNEAIEEFKNNNIDFCYLYKIDNSNRDEEIEKYKYNGKYFDKIKYENQKYNELVFEGMKDPSHIMIDSKEYNKICFELSENIIKNIDLSKYSDILVLGTEEFMYPPMFVGNEISKLNKNVFFHATTRSPICVSSEKEYPLNKRYSLSSFYDDERNTFIYNLKKYDCVIIITNSQIPLSEGCENIVSALYNEGCENIYIVRWC